MKGKLFVNFVEIKTTTTNMLSFKKCLGQWNKRLDKFINSNREYLQEIKDFFVKKVDKLLCTNIVSLFTYVLVDNVRNVYKCHKNCYSGYVSVRNVIRRKKCLREGYRPDDNIDINIVSITSSLTA